MKSTLSIVSVSLLVFSLAACRTESQAPDRAAGPSASPAPSYGNEQAFFEQEARANPEDPNSYYNLGNIYFAQGKYAEAAAQFRLALTKKVDDKTYEAELLTRLGNAHAALKQTDEAAAAYQKAAAASPSYAEARRRLADLYEQTGRAAEAARERQEATRLQPNEAGKKLYSEGKVREGLAELQKVAAKNSETHYLIGLSYFKLEQYAEAAAAFRRAVEADPKNVDAHFNLGNAYDRLNRHAEAAASFKEVVRLTPDAADAHFNLGNAYARLDRYEEAVAAYEESLRLNPDDVTARLQLTQLHLRHGNADAAARQHGELKRLNPEAAARLEQILKQGPP
jgi:tetratricopeptide (TPR) repeat protein